MNIKKEQTTYIILLVTGIFILIGGPLIVKMAQLDTFLIGGVSGFGGAWTVNSAIKLYQIRKKPEEYEKQVIEQYDERNIAIRGYAGYATFITTLLTISVMSVIFMVLDYTRPLLIGGILLLIHIVSFLVYFRYYSKKL